MSFQACTHTSSETKHGRLLMCLHITAFEQNVEIEDPLTQTNDEALTSLGPLPLPTLALACPHALIMKVGM